MSSTSVSSSTSTSTPSISFNVIEMVANLIVAVVPAFVPYLFIPSEYSKEYKQLRKDISSALVLYADCYSNPVDISKTNNQLPQKYQDASARFRELSSRLRAFLETLPCRRRKPKKNTKPGKKHSRGKSDRIPTVEQLDTAANGLMGLSNSMQTPYNCGITSEDIKNTQDFVRMVKENLRLSTAGG